MTRLPPDLPDQDGDDFPERLRTALLAAASSVDPDPAGWRLLNARIRRRRAALRGGGLALAGAAAVLVAVTVLPGGSDPRVEFAPADPAAVADSTVTAPALPDLPTADPSDPAAPSVTSPPAVTTRPPEEAAPPDAAGILYSDGSSVHVADLDGSIRSTPAALGVSTQSITDVVVRPGGTTEAFTLAYRVDGRPDASAAECGDIAWVHVPGGGAPDASGALPRTATTVEDCLGAPVFASDGSALGWLATTGDGEVQLQAVDWAEGGPVEGSLTTFGLDQDLDQAGLVDPVLVDWTLAPEESSGVGSVGTLVLRATGPGGLGTFLRPAQRQADGALALGPVESGITELVDDTGIGGPIIDAHRRWRIVRLATADAEARIGIATPPLEVDGQELPPLTGETELLLDLDARPFLDALGDTAVIGVGRAMLLVQAELGDADAPGSLMIDGELPPATSAALLAAP